MNHTFSRSAAFALVTLVMMTQTLAADTSADLFTRYGGSWTGSGVARLAGGNVESLKCKAYYTPRNNGQTLGLVIRCASPSTPLELRAALSTAQEKISGSWEERTFNATGDVRGSVGENVMDLSISGSGFTGAMQVMFVGDTQRVAITTAGIGLEAVTLSLSRMANGAGT
ncbi:MAG: hypothetical protein WC807_03200 [Hyphomicrobium sp.]